MILSSPTGLDTIPARIISLVPSLTELLFDLGLDEQVLGITKFCVHPKHWKQTKTIIGGTKNIDIEKIKTLQPELVIASKEENVKDQVETIAEIAKVYLTDVCTYSDALTAIRDIGAITGTPHKAYEMMTKISDAFSTIVPLKNIPASYLIWRDPYMTVGGDTYIHDMLSICGFKNVFGEKTRYPQISIDDIRASGCNMLLLSSEPYPFAQKHIDELQKHLPHIKIKLVDGEMFSWYGSRMLQAPKYFNELIRTVKNFAP